MSTYIPAYKGYITDVPEVWFKRSDGKVFHYDKITACSVTPNANFTEVDAGWSLFPSAYLPGKSTMELQMTSGEFNADLFAMANDTNFVEKTFAVPHSVEVNVGTAKTAVIKTPVSIKNSVVISGMASGEAAAEGVYVIAETSEGTGDEKYVTTLTFDSALGDIEVTYYVEETANVIEISNDTAAMGELICKWPVYANGQETKTAGVKGYVLEKIFKCRVTQMPGFDTNYKSAATNSVTFATMDARRADGKVYSIAYVENK